MEPKLAFVNEFVITEYQLLSELPDVGGEPIWPLAFPFAKLLKLREPSLSLSPEG